MGQAATYRTEWTPALDASLRTLWPEASWAKLAVAFPTSSRAALTHRAQRLGLGRKRREDAPETRAALVQRMTAHPLKLGKVLYPVVARDGVPCKCCSRCSTWKPLEQFSAHAYTSGGVRNICKHCEVVSQKDWRSARPPEAKRKDVARAIRYMTAHPEAKKRWKQVYAHKRRVREGAASGITSAEWAEIQERFGGLCAYCKEAPGSTMDHVIPLSRGGAHDASNVVPACQSCNSKKHARTPAEWAAATQKGG